MVFLVQSLEPIFDSVMLGVLESNEKMIFWMHLYRESNRGSKGIPYDILNVYLLE